MLIHIGNNEFVDLNQIEAILNLAAIDQESRSRILRQLPKEIREHARAAILCCNGKWLASTLSPEALAQRGSHAPFGVTGLPGATQVFNVRNHDKKTRRRNK